ncbi:MAG: PRC-barrel domain-containing protein [Cytophagaceae bacterium]
MKNQHLYKLSELSDYEVANEDPDIRSWEVVGIGNELIGRVNDLIVDKAMKKVRYVDVKAFPELAHSAGDRHLIIPIGFVKLGKEGDDRVYVDRLDKQKLLRSPVYHGGVVTRDYEHSLIEVLRGERSQALSDDEFYSDPFFNDTGLSR